MSEHIDSDDYTYDAPHLELVRPDELDAARKRIAELENLFAPIQAAYYVYQERQVESNKVPMTLQAFAELSVYKWLNQEARP